MTGSSPTFFCAEPSFLSQANRVSRKPLQHLVELYEAWGKPEPAAEWKRKLAEFNKAVK